MLELLFYESAHDAPLPRMDLEAALCAEGISLDGADGDAYRPGRWRDAATGANAIIDLGRPPIEDDPLHPPTTYDGWRPLDLTIQIPLAGPHWLCVECLALVERLLARLPGCRALDTEDTARDGETPGPRPWNRPRALASWERLHHGQQDTRTDLRRMARLTSVCLWRYRRERAAGLAAHPDLRWPEALVLWDTVDRTARSACFWHDPAIPFALPTVDLLIVRRGDSTGVLTSDLLAAAHPTPLPHAGASAIQPSPDVARLYAEAPLLPIARFQALDDADWND